MPSGLEAVKRAALETYVTLCSADARHLRALDEHQTNRRRPEDDESHARAALAWLCRAHDMGTDDGVSAMFSLVEGWMGSYPETTGYIIPTFFDAAHAYGETEYRERAVEMARWLCGCQAHDGSFPGSFVGRLSSPRVFNTGQIVFGLVRAAAETGEQSFLDAAVRAGDWLLSRQSDDGAWRQSTLNGIVHAYNVRTAWALTELAAATGQERYQDSAIRNATWATNDQDDSGWFQHNAFDTTDAGATLHTIAYAMRGLLEVGVATGELAFIESADRAAGALLRGWRLYHKISGAFGRDWSAEADWRCLPGELQLAIGWLRLDEVSGCDTFTDTAIQLIESVKASQVFDEGNPDIHGGISGSLPINGGYERYCLVSWGPKFLIDALLYRSREDGGHPVG